MNLLKNLPVESESQVESQSPICLRSQRDKVQGYDNGCNSRLGTLERKKPKIVESQNLHIHTLKFLTDSKNTPMGEKTARSLGEKR